VADLEALTFATRKAVKACEEAPFIVRAHLAPLRDFVLIAFKAIADQNAEINAAGGCPGNCKKET
jgi:hypothetical protein